MVVRRKKSKAPRSFEYIVFAKDGNPVNLQNPLNLLNLLNLSVNAMEMQLHPP